MVFSRAERTPSNNDRTNALSPRAYQLRLALLVLASALCLYAYFWPHAPASKQTDSIQPPIKTISSLASIDPLPSSADAPQDAAATTHIIQPGDTLSGIFSQRNIDAATMNAVLAADEELLALDVLRPGNTLHFEQAPNSIELLALSLVVHPGRTIHYRRATDGFFEFEEEIKPSYWHEDVFSAQIRGSFYTSASQTGLSDGEILQAQRILEDRVNFHRDIQVDDRFEIVLSREMVDAGSTGQTRIEAIRLQGAKLAQSAFLHVDGNYYNDNGESLSRAFLRHPMQGNYRVSSPFNLRRLHPVTKRIAPHHGVDFAMPTGTPILSTGDGVVSRIGNHPYAGQYIEVEHPGQFKTRYLHLSQVQVKQGQQVSRGDRIALSGNTGRSTGPHLHFELHVNNRPVDPLKADIPTATRIPAKEMALFRNRVATLVAVMDNRLHLASRMKPNAQNTDG
ncbi:peptidase M23 [Pseudomonas nabeulensis]|uniref:Peptidase M23 n=1 Tax=Pseudomonas nabeulensis TaxID=2293833 RepID=A0A4Z0B7Y8_9PSED|nr:peptidoglycan DD-metalloendopeptidase family protein [Pseudomonas nabeulensis]TFY95175.1 peptidase M23 [Pseudomonas nabeulensis]